ncbi:DUF2975 domain-containing protein [Streptomyces sp. NPDC050560]|uniref:DUF2975 domain-containing protein n=1 Tax=Streptomyces sp. NPDC050560 TaxID=3365630 RepID=UPI0037A30FD5
MDTRLTRNLASVTFAISVICGLGFVAKTLTHATDDGMICVETGFWHNTPLGSRMPVADGVEATGAGTRLCQDAPSAGQRAAEIGGALPWLLFAALALMLFSRLLKCVLDKGPFTDAVSRRLSTLGWFVALGTPLTGLVVGWSHSWLVGSMAPMIGSGPTVSGPLVLVVAGLAAVIMGRIMRDGVRMREDLEGTV